MKQQVFSGCGTALITPFRAGEIDYASLKSLIQQQLAAGVDALVVCGTTAEAATLTREERRELIAFVIREADHKIPVIVGTGSNNTAQAIVLSEEAQKLGADALLVVTPYYNKATQQGLIEHFTAIAQSVSPLPIILYNVPSRTGVSCTADTYRELSKVENIVGVKEASGNFSLIQATRRLCGDTFAIWSGNDEDTAALALLGGSGVISVASNLLPQTISALTKLCRCGRYEEAGRLQVVLAPLIKALFCEVNPIPIKTALAAKRLCCEEFRLPLCPMSEANKKELLNVMDEYRDLK